MPYIFGILVVANALLLGYFLFIHQPSASETVLEEQTQLIQPIEFQNTSEHVPPLIGTKK